MTGAWRHRGGGAFHSDSGAWKLDKSLITGAEPRKARRPRTRHERDRPHPHRRRQGAEGRPPVKALFIQNTNPVNVTPDQALTRAGLCARGPLHRRPRAVHDRDGRDGRHRPARDHVPRAQRLLSPRRPHARAATAQSSSRRRARHAPTSRSSTICCAASAPIIPRSQMTDREWSPRPSADPTSASSTRSRRPASSRTRSPRTLALRQRLCLARRQVSLRARLAGRRRQEGLPLDLRSSRDAALRRLVGRQRADRARASVPPRDEPARARSSTRPSTKPPAARSGSRSPRCSSAPTTPPPRHRRRRSGRPRQPSRRSRAHRRMCSTACRQAF